MQNECKHEELLTAIFRHGGHCKIMFKKTDCASLTRSFPMRMRSALRIIVGGILTSLLRVAVGAPAQWPAHVVEVQIPSSADGTAQPAMFYAPPGTNPVPLLVSLHTWSDNYQQRADVRANWCLKHKWAFVHPNFRGPNKTPEAMGSDLAVRDILDAVDYARSQTVIDESRIYMLGFSGGGHAALLLAGRAPEVWAGVSVWCGISDLKKWHSQNRGYGRHIEAALQGNPQTDDQVAVECMRRSPVTWLEKARHIPIDIAAGIHDGHTGSVPVSQSLEAFNLLADPDDQLAETDINIITSERSIPAHLQSEGGGLLLNKIKIHFQRQSGNARITIFEGGHRGMDGVALPWLALQRKGKPAVWQEAGQPSEISLDVDAASSGK
jgi:poly(3-hydroxybutyrate) depolymerase